MAHKTQHWPRTNGQRYDPDECARSGVHKHYMGYCNCGDQSPMFKSQHAADCWVRRHERDNPRG